MTEEPQLQAQGVFDLMRLADKDLISKLLAVVKTVNIQELEDGITRISIDLVRKPVS